MAHRNSSLAIKRSILLLALCVITLMLSLWTYASHSRPFTSQDEEKMLEKGDDFNPPVKITLVKSKIGIIETDKKIVAGSEWLKG